MNTTAQKRLSPTVYYLLTGLALSWPGLLASGHLFTEWSQGLTETPISLGTIHLLILGSMLTIAFGVIYQIVPIAFQAPPIQRDVLYWHLPLHILAVVTIVIGFLFSHYDLVGAGGLLLLITTVAYGFLVFRSYSRARNQTLVHKTLSLPLISLFIVLCIGIFQAFFPPLVSHSVLTSHVIVGGFTFWGALVITFSYKLVPMFALSHGYSVSLSRTIRLYFIGVISIFISLWIANPLFSRVLSFSGSLLVIFALFSFIRDMILIIRSRKRRRIVLPLFNALVSTGCFVIGHILLMLAILLQNRSFLIPSVFLFGFGGIMPLMFAYIQKIVPFLWFEYRFSKRPERKQAPAIDEMVPRGISQMGIGVYYAGVVCGLLVLLQGNISSQSLWTYIQWLAAIFMTSGSLLLFLALRHVLTIGGPRPQE